jgi:hypothetical protein
MYLPKFYSAECVEGRFSEVWCGLTLPSQEKTM